MDREGKAEGAPDGTGETEAVPGGTGEPEAVPDRTAPAAHVPDRTAPAADVPERTAEPAGVPDGAGEPAAWSIRGVLAAAAVVAAATVATMLIVAAFGGTERWRDAVEQAGPWAPLVYVLLKASTYVAAPLSGTSLKLASGALFGVWEGFWYTLIGGLLGGSLNFWIARRLGRPAVRRLAGAGALSRIDRQTTRLGGWRALLAARVFLAPFYDFVSYAAGFSGLPYRHYLAVSVLGGIPASLFFVVLGDAAAQGGWLPYAILAGCLAAGLVVSAIYLLRHRRGRPPANHRHPGVSH